MYIPFSFKIFLCKTYKVSSSPRIPIVARITGNKPYFKEKY